MKIIKYLSLIFICLVFIDVKAVDKCTTEEMDRLRNLAKNVQFKTSFEIDEIKMEDEAIGAKAYYNISIINNHDDLKFYYSTASTNKTEINLANLPSMTFNDGESINIYIYSYSNNLCTDELLRTETIKFPKYNVYYYKNKDKCSKYPEFKYCREFMDTSNIDYDKIEKEFKEYTKVEDRGKILNFIQNNIYFIIGGVIVLIISIIFLVMYLKRRKDRLDI